MGSRQRMLEWAGFLDDVLPECLAEAGTSEAGAQAVVRDVGRRAHDYAAGGKAARRLLRAPFLDDVAEFLPEEAPIGPKADVAVVVRNSILELEHARGPVDGGLLARITYVATGALNRWLSETANHEENAAPCGVFAPVVDSPRASAALAAMGLAAESGGRKAIRKSPVEITSPTIPGLGEAPPPDDLDDAVTWLNPQVRSGLDPVDEDMIRMLRRIENGKTQVLFTSSLSRYSRDCARLAEVVEFVLGHGGTILTTNFLIRPREVFARRGPLIGANSADPLRPMSTDRLSGLHARYVREVLDEMGPAPEV